MTVRNAADFDLDVLPGDDDMFRWVISFLTVL